MIHCDNDHIYTVDGITVPGVSELLSLVYPNWFLERNTKKGERGTFFHSLTTHIDTNSNKLVELSKRQEVSDWIDLYKETVSPYDIGKYKREKKLYHDAIGVCGTADRISENSIIDFKTGVKNEKDQFQVLFYLVLSGISVPATLHLMYFDLDKLTSKVESIKIVPESPLLIKSYAWLQSLRNVWTFKNGY